MKSRAGFSKPSIKLAIVPANCWRSPRSLGLSIMLILHLEGVRLHCSAIAVAPLGPGRHRLGLEHIIRTGFPIGASGFWGPERNGGDAVKVTEWSVGVSKLWLAKADATGHGPGYSTRRKNQTPSQV